MKRRDFISGLHKIAAFSALGGVSGKLWAAPEDYTGRLFVTVQAAGAWDIASFCDPKKNIAGEAPINNWAHTQDIASVGNLRYAPVAANAAFFTKHYTKLCVINGVDMQTNSHSTGVLHNWSGRNSAGFPSLTALFAARFAPQLPLAYLNYGGYAETARLIRYTRLNDVNSLLTVLTPNVLPWDRNGHYQNPDMLALVQAHQQKRLERLRAQPNLLPRTRYALDSYYAAQLNAQSLKDFAAVIPDASELESNRFKQQMQITLLAFQSGVACSADMVLDGFDTHANHDRDHFPKLTELTQGIDYLWDYAETLGLADRLTVLVGSDFSRTPWYNSSNGKDHWPIGTVLVMEKNAPFGNRLWQATDDSLHAVKVDPVTLKPSAAGTVIYPKHIHKALRQHLGIAEASLDDAFPLNAELLPLLT